MIVYQPLHAGRNSFWHSGPDPRKQPIQMYAVYQEFWGNKYRKTPFAKTGWDSVSENLTWGRLPFWWLSISGSKIPNGFSIASSNVRLKTLWCCRSRGLIFSESFSQIRKPSRRGSANSGKIENPSDQIYHIWKKDNVCISFPWPWSMCGGCPFP